MADIGRSSFIPKDVAGLTPGKMRRRQTFHLFGFVATSMILGSLALSIGVYYLETSAKNQLSEAQQRLSEQKDLFKPEYVSEVREFDRRLQAGDALLRNHIAPLKIFAALEEVTKQSVQFTNLTIEHNPGREIFLSLDGVTTAFKSLALQEIEFSDKHILKNIFVSDIGVGGGEDGSERNVAFSLKGVIDTKEVQYDGSPVYTITPTAFIETEGGLAIGEATPAVLGDTIISEDI